MSTTDYLQARFPLLGERLPRLHLAELPTPVVDIAVTAAGGSRRLSVKRDDLTGKLYGGNKLRKLEYIFPLARNRACTRIATFGAVGSNSALATALYARRCGFDSTCFLMHQAKTPQVPATLNMHLRNGTELIRYGGRYAKRVETLRKHLWGRRAWIIPMGCSSWRGTVGFVTAGLELAAQIDAGDTVKPDRIYVGTGTMGTAVGIALGLAIAGVDAEVHAVRVSDIAITNERAMQKLLAKTVAMLRRADASVPADLAGRARIRLRHEFFGPGYAQATAAADAAIALAGEQLDLRLEATYTGKTLAALLADLRQPDSASLNLLYWHTYSGIPADIPADRPLDTERIPAEFLRYFSTAR